MSTTTNGPAHEILVLIIYVQKSSLTLFVLIDDFPKRVDTISMG